MNCYRYLGMTSQHEVDMLTMREYRMLIQAAELRWVDRRYFVHLQAFQNMRIKAVEGRGKGTVPVYGSFDRFFNYEKEQDMVMKGKDGGEETGIAGRVKQFLRRKEKSNGRE